MSDLTFASISEISALIREQRLSPVELLETCLQAIDAYEPRLNSFVTLFRDRSFEMAQAAAEEIRNGRYRGALHGVPIALKDLIYIEGTRTTCGARILSGFIAPFDATVVTRLKYAGAILLGKTNLHEFAFGVTTENPHFGTTANPWDLNRIAGGSSGGSSVAVVAGFCHGALGTDTGGSVRIPSALCGNVGLKPTFGRVSVRGVVELARSLDCVGPMCRHAEDAAHLMNTLAGHDKQDPLSADVPVSDYAAELSKSVRGIRVGVPQQHFFENCDPGVERMVREAIQQLGSVGMEIVDLDLPCASEAHAAVLPILASEAAAFHRERLNQQRQAFGTDVREMLERGERFTPADLAGAGRMGQTARAEFESAFEQVDVIATPTVPIPAPVRSDVEVSGASESNRLRPLLTQNTRIFNLVGLPALSAPCGFTSAGLPVGLQLAGPWWSEARLLQVAHAYQQVTEWHTQRPPLDPQ